MTGQDYRKAMECFTPAPSLRERAAAAAEPGKRPRVRPWRTWLVAAVVCMALVGMAVAAKSPELLLFWENKPDIGDGYTVQSTVELLPADTFSPVVAALAAAEEPNNHKYFDTWDEMEQFIGLDLADNPVLDEAEPGSLGTQPWDMDHTEQGTTHILLLPVCEDDGELSIVQCMGSYVLDGVWVRMMEFAYTERAKGTIYYHMGSVGDGERPMFGMVCPEGSETSEETYTTPSGLTALIVKTVWQSKGGGSMCDAHFQIGGAAFSVTVGGGSSYGLVSADPDQTMGILKRVLDGFALN